MKFFFLSIITCLSISACKQQSADSVEYCGTKYQLEKKDVYLTDEDVTVTFMQVLKPGNKQFVFGYELEGIRNDTNFIFSRIEIDKDTIKKTSFHNYNITPGMDSIVSRFICKPDGLLFYNHQTFFNGRIVKDLQPMKMMDSTSKSD